MYGLTYVALRYFNVYGPRMDIHGNYTEVLVRWMERIEAGEPPMILGDGKQTMDFVHVERRRAGEHPRGSSPTCRDEVFNVASGTETSLSELAGALLARHGFASSAELGPERQVNPVPRRLGRCPQGGADAWASGQASASKRA